MPRTTASCSPSSLHGRQRCDGLAAVTRIRHVLEPLRKRGDFGPASTRSALTHLGYATAKVRSYQDGPAGVGFLTDASPMCPEGTMSSRTTEADAFGGYPDHFGCDQPQRRALSTGGVLRGSACR
ncbi:hypothetical protein [Streptomyces violascens]|uniref:Uncharacterized protein n=1 Tax=Streptomyces violascens TaxID=67381 RepID=A0ABQ3QFY7_9ACTN|nr:hypothetical protein [Streptomyces violascens]GGT88338.1 hypothetical protein GCM10010289_05430 [Streptomyces violascens]GHI36209.1 hypothetical protein Sviol_06170 [Streptomyces violascens]